MHKNNPVFLITILVIAGILFSGCRIDDSEETDNNSNIEDTDDEDTDNTEGNNITVSIDQSDVLIYTGQSFQFTATVQNASDNRVTWSLSSTVNMDRGSISNDGLYMPAHINVLSKDTVTVTVTATSLEDTSASDSLEFLVEKRFHLVADINSGGVSGNPSNFIVYNHKLYFRANGGINGYELWCYDGTNPPWEVADINIGAGNSSPLYLTVYNNKLYFSAEGDNGRELWYYDGDDVVEVDINAAGESSPAYLTVYNDRLYFSADGGNGHGSELWCCDSNNSCQEVEDINSGAEESNPGYLTVYNNRLYFRAEGDNGRELWYYDGNDVVEIDINGGAADSNPEYLTVYNNKLYFKADGGNDHGRELWYCDSNNSCQEVDDIYNGANGSKPEGLTVYNGKLYFKASDENGHGEELWCYDNANPPFEVVDIMTGGDGLQYPYEFIVFNDRLFFCAEGDTDNGLELWCYDDSIPIEEYFNPEEMDIYSGSDNGDPLGYIVFNSKLYFEALGADGHGYELWICNY
jgi:ELWxxDGT repeat protein